MMNTEASTFAAFHERLLTQNKNSDMKKLPILLLAALLSITSCTTYQQATTWNRSMTGAYLGSMFGSLIGDAVGGHHGSHVGAAIGSITGAAIGAASAQNHEENRHNKRHNYDYSYDDGIYYGNGRDYTYVAPTNPAAYLSIDNIVFADYNGNRVLQGGETAYVTFDIHNTSNQPIYNIAPIITCDNRRIKISPTATIARIDAGRAMRYKAIVKAQNNVHSGQTTFYIGFAEHAGKLDPGRSFRINVRR